MAVVRRRLGIRAVGHAGTLDPFATGLLVVLTGRATRLARFVESERKRYTAVIALGRATDTEDGTGVTTAETVPDHWPEVAEVDAALEGLSGTIRQRPPAYSAKHVAGTRSHALARAGRPVALPEVDVTVHRFARTAWTPPRLTVEAEVGKGTYLRALARDVGLALGLPAHCAELRRTGIGPFEVDAAVSPGDVSTGHLRSAAEMVAHLPSERVGAEAVQGLGFGRRVPGSAAGHGPVAMLAEDDGRLVAIAEPAGDGWWQPVVVLEPAA